MSPNIAYLNIRLQSMKVFVDSMKHSFRCIIKCAGQRIASQTYGGSFAVDFSKDAVSENCRIPIKSMFSTLEIEVYATPNISMMTIRTRKCKDHLLSTKKRRVIF